MTMTPASGWVAFQPSSGDVRPGSRLAVRLGLLFGLATAIYLLCGALDRPAYADERSTPVPPVAGQRSAPDQPVVGLPVGRGADVPSLPGVTDTVTGGLHDLLTVPTPPREDQPGEPSTEPGQDTSKPTKPSRPDGPATEPDDDASRPDRPSTGPSRPGRTHRPPAHRPERPAGPDSRPAGPDSRPVVPGLPVVPVEGPLPTPGQLMTGTVDPLGQPLGDLAGSLPLGLGSAVDLLTGVIVDTVSTVGTVVDGVVAIPAPLLPGLERPAPGLPMPVPTSPRPPAETPCDRAPPTGAPPTAQTTPGATRAPEIVPPCPTTITAGPPVSPRQVAEDPTGVRTGGGDRPLRSPALPATPLAGAGRGVPSSSSSGPVPAVGGRDHWEPQSGRTGRIFGETTLRVGRVPLTRHVPG